MDGEPVFVDPGTYCYTSDLKLRNQFRATAAHSTVMVDGQEINRIPPNEPFRLEQDAGVRVLEWHVGDDEVYLGAQHNSCRHLDRPGVHRRSVRYMPAEQTWLIEDILQVDRGEHTAKVKWYFMPGSDPNVQPRQHGLAISVGGVQLHIAITDVEQWNYRIEQGWISPAYGVKQVGPVLCIIARFCGTCGLRMSARNVNYEAGLELSDSTERGAGDFGPARGSRPSPAILDHPQLR